MLNIFLNNWSFAPYCSLNCLLYPVAPQVNSFWDLIWENYFFVSNCYERNKRIIKNDPWVPLYRAVALIWHQCYTVLFPWHHLPWQQTNFLWLWQCSKDKSVFLFVMLNLCAYSKQTVFPLVETPPYPTVSSWGFLVTL